jgi:catechol 2,3-dioxygenase
MKIHELGHIVFYVSNLERSSHFYRDILGFTEIHRDLHTALYSSGRTHHELLLIEVGGTKSVREYVEPGLYHVGIKIGTTDLELRNAIDELTAHGVPIVGSADHHVTHSIYILDPDQNELELYVDVDDTWKSDMKKIMQPPKLLAL